MRISVFGLGYVGAVSASCFADMGHDVTGMDLDEHKVSQINRGLSPIVEKGVEALLQKGLAAGRLRATVSHVEALAQSDVSIICVGTPSTAAGRLDLTILDRAAGQIGQAMRHHGRRGHTIILRSTVLPGTTETFLVPRLEANSGMRAGVDFNVIFNPEFLREGSAVADFWTPPKTVVGAASPEIGQKIAPLYDRLPGPHFQTVVRVAEMVKYVDNSFHALKVAFANEIGQLCASEGVESQDVMNIFKSDTKLNIAPTYLRPGFAFGGSCLPKDLRAIICRARDHDLALPLLSTILESNELLIRRAVQLVQALGTRKVGVLGLAFKVGTDDLRESPMVEVAERLLGKGIQLSIHDGDVKLAHLRGANKAFISTHLPHIETLLTDDLDSVVRNFDVLLIGRSDPLYRKLPQIANGRHTIVDLVRLFEQPPTCFGRYMSIV